MSYLALEDELDVCVRTGSVNAAHTVWYQGESHALHMVPGAFINDQCRLLIGAGANIQLEQFLKEVEETEVKDRIGVDPQASIIEEKHSVEDKTRAHLKGIGTTGRGVGPAIEERVARTAKLAKNIPQLKPYLTDVPQEVNQAIEDHKNVLLEGTQGLMLSLFYGTYPYVTGRDTSASAICSEAGIGPTKVNNVLTVLKAFITRVGGGPLPGEVSKAEAKKRGWFETAAGTGRDRRSAPFNFEIAKKALMINGATQIALTKLDILHPRCQGATEYDKLPEKAEQFVTEIEKETGIPVALISTGPGARDVIDRRT